MKFNDLRLHNSDRIEVGAFKIMVTSDIRSQHMVKVWSKQRFKACHSFLERFGFVILAIVPPYLEHWNDDCLIATFNCYWSKIFINLVFYECTDLQLNFQKLF